MQTKMTQKLFINIVNLNKIIWKANGEEENRRIKK